MTEITYKGKHSFKDFDIIAKSINRPMIPTLTKKQLRIPGKHGSYDFDENEYENRFISVLFQFVGTDENNMRLQARDIAAWLSGTTYEPLTFNDEPDKYYLARIYDAVELGTFAKLGVCTIEFECLPFALYQVSSGEEVIIDNDLLLDSDITLNPTDPYTMVVTSNTSANINYIGTQDVGLGSPDGSKFDIVITGSFSTLSITINGRTINYNTAVSEKTVIINNVDATIKANGNNALFNCTGDLIRFLKLVPGNNTVSITGTGLNCTVLFDFRPQYL